MIHLPRYGLRVVGPFHSERRLVDHAAAFAGYAECDPGAELDRESYLSYFIYTEDFKEHFEAIGSERGYSGPCGAPWIWFDIDRADDLQCALNDARRLCGALLERYRDLDEDDLLIFLSGGKGFHVGIPIIWSPEPSPNFNVAAKAFALQRASEAGIVVDPTVFSKTRLFRAPNSRHAKTGRYKRRISFGEFMHSKLEFLIGRAEQPEAFDIPTGPAASERAADDWKQAMRSVGQRAGRGAATTRDGSARLPVFAQRYLREGEMDDDQRAVSTFRVAAQLSEFYTTHGFDALVHELVTETALDSGLTPSEVKKQIDGGLAHGRNNGEIGS